MADLTVGYNAEAGPSVSEHTAQHTVLITPSSLTLFPSAMVGYLSVSKGQWFEMRDREFV